MKKVFIVHGFMGMPNGLWKTWLMSELKKKDVYACSLPMPNPAEPKSEEWVRAIDFNIGEPNEDIILVGHSLGVAAIMRYLELIGLDQKIGGAVLVSGPYKKLLIDKLAPFIRNTYNFFETDFNFKKIRESCDKFVIVHAKDDLKVPYSHGEYLAEKLNAKLVTLQMGGHLSGHEGVNEIPEVLDALLDLMNE